VSTLIPALWICLFAAILLCAFFWHWLVYSLYRSLDDVRRKFVYTEFSFQFQSPWLARQLGGPMFIDALSPEEQMQVAAANRQARRVMAVFAVFCALVFFGILGGLASDLVRHGTRH
jgi:TRAP-type C4-dicarboxylate transport system permease small subunit